MRKKEEKLFLQMLKKGMIKVKIRLDVTATMQQVAKEPVAHVLIKTL